VSSEPFSGADDVADVVNCKKLADRVCMELATFNVAAINMTLTTPTRRVFLLDFLEFEIDMIQNFRRRRLRNSNSDLDEARLAATD